MKAEATGIIRMLDSTSMTGTLAHVSAVSDPCDHTDPGQGEAFGHDPADHGDENHVEPDQKRYGQTQPDGQHPEKASVGDLPSALRKSLRIIRPSMW